MIERNFVTPDTLAAIDDVNRRCHELHVPAPPVVFVTTELFERDGSPVLRQKEQARSWTRNFYNFLASQCLMSSSNIDPESVDFGPGSLRLKTVAGAVRSGSPDYYVRRNSTSFIYSLGYTTDTDQGIVVGSGSGEADLENTALGSIIGHGTGSGQMVYVQAISNTPSYDSGIKKWTRTFYREATNLSGSSIIIREVGLQEQLQDSASGNRSFMLERTLLTSPVEVADGQTLRVTYTIEMTFPA